MTTPEPLSSVVPGGVSVVIPTVDRLETLGRAVRSALGQTHAPIEVLVVQDGAAAEAVRAGLGLADPRVRVLQTGQASSDGGATARNIGVRAAAGEWVAFLDDDDEWLPDKLRIQLAAVAACADPTRPTVLSGRMEWRDDVKPAVWPLRAPRNGERVGEYLFVRKLPGEGWLATSALMVRRADARAVPFREGLRQHVDYDWVLDLEERGATFVVVPDVVAVMYAPTGRRSVSTRATWTSSLQWATARRAALGERAFSAFCLTEVARRARQGRSLRGFLGSLQAATSGKPRALDVLNFFGLWLAPPPVVRTVRVLRRSSILRRTLG